MILPRARTSSSLDLPAAAALSWAAAGPACATMRPAPATAPDALVMKSRLEPIFSSSRWTEVFCRALAVRSDRGRFVLGRHGSVADGERPRAPEVDVLRETFHRPPDRDVEPADDVLDFRFGDDQRRTEAHVMLDRDRGHALEQRVVANALGHDRVRHAGLRILDDVEHAVEPLAADVAHHRVLRLEGLELAHRKLAELFGSLREVVAQHDLELLERDRGDEGIARIRPRPRQSRIAPDLFGDLGRGDRAADREPRRESFAEGDDVGRHAIVLE